MTPNVSEHTPDEPEKGSLRASITVWTAVVLSLVIAYFSAATGELLAEDFQHLAQARSYASPAAAMDLERVPLRPLQHLVFYYLAQVEPLNPALIRLPAFLLHLGSCVLIWHLARELGAGARGSQAALLMFAAFPNLIAIVTPAAMSGPGRVFFVLAALLLFIRNEREPRATRVLGILICFLLALGFHNAGIVLPVFFAAWILTDDRALARGRRRATLSRFLRPAMVLTALLVLGYLVYFTVLRPQRHHGFIPLSAVPANVVRATLSVFPEAVRTSAVDALRGHAGIAGFLIAGTVFGAIAMAYVLVLARGPRAARFVLFAATIELAVPVLTTGFSNRYAYLSSALLACALGVGWDQLVPTARQSRLAMASLLALGALWSIDTVQDAREYRRASTAAREVLDACRRERALAGPAKPIAVVDLPERWGAEKEIPFFGLGFSEALSLYDIPGEWLPMRTREQGYWTSDHDLVTREELSRTLDERDLAVLRFSPRVGTIERFGPPLIVPSPAATPRTSPCEATWARMGADSREAAGIGSGRSGGEPIRSVRKVRARSWAPTNLHSPRRAPGDRTRGP